jgi:hypothetical protein
VLVFWPQKGENKGFLKLTKILRFGFSGGINGDFFPNKIANFPIIWKRISKTLYKNPKCMGFKFVGDTCGGILTYSPKAVLCPPGLDRRWSNKIASPWRLGSPDLSLPFVTVKPLKIDSLYTKNGSKLFRRIK